MARLPRLAIPDVAVHIVQRGNDRQSCFKAETDYLVYLANLRELSAKLGCAVHAYCLMTNHVHLLVTPRLPRSFSQLMQALGRRYVYYFNDRYDRTGTLWEGRFRSCLVESTDYVLACYRYIELNPVRAGMVQSPSDYPWSSHRVNAGAVDDRLITPHPEFDALASDLANRHNAYRRLFDVADRPEFLAAVRDATNGGFALASEGSKPMLAARCGRRVERAKPGRRPEHGDDAFTGELGL